MHRWDLVAVVINGVIGAGIFGLPAKAFSLAGDYSLISFLVCALCAVLIVLSFAEVSSRFSGTGGPYLYAREAYGPAAGFTVGWLVWVARVAAFAANCNLLLAYLAHFFPGADAGAARAIFITVLVAVLAALNLRGVRLVADAGNTLAVGKLLPLAIFVAAGLFFLDPARFSFAQQPTYQAFSQSVLLLIYGFTGFEMAAIPAGEVRDPQRTLPRALITGILVVVVFYVLIQVVCIGTLPGLASSERPLADAASRFMGPWGAILITIGIALSLAGNLNVLILSASRILFAMAENGELPTVFARIHPARRTPVPAILATTLVVLALTLSGTFIYLLTLSAITRLIAYMATCGALPLLRRKTSAPPAAFHLPYGILIAFSAVALGLWLISSSTLREARDTAIAAALGLAVYALSQTRKPPLARREIDS
jgi:basic amino acid/polyamine antiporter, APA family